MNQFEIRLIVSLLLLLGYVCSYAYDIETTPKEEATVIKTPSHASRGSYVYGGIGWAELDSWVYKDWYIGKPEKGLDWQLGYEWIPKRTIGAGAIYYGYAGKGSEEIYGSLTKNTLLINYLAPQFVARFCSKYSVLALKGTQGMVCLTGSAGLGLGLESQHINSDNGGYSYRHTKAGLGWNVSVKIELKISRKISLYAMLTYLDSYMKRPKDDPYYIKERIVGGWNMYALSAGVTYCL